MAETEGSEEDKEKKTIHDKINKEYKKAVQIEGTFFGSCFLMF